jgi:hypothetical protein
MHRRIGLLQQCLEEVLYHTESEGFLISLKARCDAYITAQSIPSDSVAFASLTEADWNTFTLATLVPSVALLMKDVELLPVMTLYIPVAFTDTELEPLAHFVRETIPHAMFDIHIDPQVIGGCAFVYNDTYHQYSLKGYMHEHKGLVTSLLQSYV